MKIEMDIKDGKIILKDEQSGLTSTQKTTQKTKNGTSSSTADFPFADGTSTTYKFKFLDEDSKKEENDVVKEEFETNFDGTKNLNRFNTGQIAITMSTLDKPDIDQIADIDKDIPGYDRIRVFDSMERKCDITIINDGPNSLYLIVNRNGIGHEEEMWSQAEIMIYPGEAWKIYHVHEIRIRSETQGNIYRITEDDIIASSTIRSVM